MTESANGNTDSYISEADAAAVVDTVNCEYEPDDPSCQNSRPQSSTTRPTPSPAPSPSRPTPSPAPTPSRPTPSPSPSPSPTRPTSPVAPQPSQDEEEVEVDQFGNEITD